MQHAALTVNGDCQQLETIVYRAIVDSRLQSAFLLHARLIAVAMKCYMKSSASSRHHDADADDTVEAFSGGVLEFQEQYQDLFVR